VIRNLVILVGIGFLASACSKEIEHEELQLKADQPSKPNIVFFLIDDMGWQDTGHMGSTYYDTPSIDRLAAQSVRFDHGYSAAANCAPSRAAIMSGQYAPRTGIYTVRKSDRGESEQRRLIPTENTWDLENDLVTLAESIKAAGYATAFMGKWHLGDGEQSGPLIQGFDINIGGNRSGAGSYFAPYENPNMEEGPDGEYMTDRLTDEAVKFIEAQDAETPFFLYLSHFAVHTPIEAPDATIAKYEKRSGDDFHNKPEYGAMLDHVDQSVGRILDLLEEKGFDDNTLIVFTSDNGGYGPATQSPDLRAAKGYPWEGGNRVPFLIRQPDRRGAGRVVNEPVIAIDFYPTLVELAGGTMPEGQIADGLSLTPILDGGDALGRDSLYFHFPAYLQAYREDSIVPENGDGWRATPFGSIRMGRYKLIEFFEFGQIELYDLQQDPLESNNIALDQPDVTATLYERMLAWREETGAPVPTELNPEYDPQYAPQAYITWTDVAAKR
jgi:arylsulfatase A-like enzyme